MCIYEFFIFLLFFVTQSCIYPLLAVKQFSLIIIAHGMKG